jgi:hypothetical protein
MSPEKSIRKDVWPASYCDLGEIRTESADRSTPPEKKERLGVRGNKTPRNLQGAAFMYICSLNSLATPTSFSERIFKLRICASKLNIHLERMLCQAQSHIVAHYEFFVICSLKSHSNKKRGFCLIREPV